MRWCAVAGIVAALGLLAPPATADDPVVYTGCIQKSNGSLYNVREGTAPMQPCKSKDKQISWNMAGQPGPEGPPGPSLPRELTFFVDCDNGESINDALAHQAERLTVYISGMCIEGVLVNRDHVLLAAADTSDPPTITQGGTGVGGAGVTVSRARDVTLRYLTIDGGNGVGVRADNSQATLEFCEIRNMTPGVLMEGLSALEIRDTWIHDNIGRGIEVEGGGAVTVRRSEIETTAGAAMLLTASIANVFSSTIRDNTGGIEAHAGSVLIMESSEVSGNGWGITVTRSSSVQVRSSTISGNTGGIAGENNSSVYLTDVAVSDSPTSGIAVNSSSNLELYGRCVVTGNGYGVTAHLSSSFVAYSPDTTIYGNQVGVTCQQSVGLCLEHGGITDSIQGCGPGCQDQQ